ncbi:MAG: hypothetical protein RL136_2537 [Planctomycetota bacterium]
MAARAPDEEGVLEAVHRTAKTTPYEERRDRGSIDGIRNPKHRPAARADAQDPKPLAARAPDEEGVLEAVHRTAKTTPHEERRDRGSVRAKGSHGLVPQTKAPAAFAAGAFV